MRYLSIDVETTGLDPERDAIVEIGIIADDLGEPYEHAHSFQAYIHPDDGAPGAVWDGASDFILNLHRELRSKWYAASPQKTLDDDISGGSIRRSDLVEWIYSWLCLIGWADAEEPSVRVNVAGKNYATFDSRFLTAQIPGWGKRIVTRHRIVDPAVLCLRPYEDDSLPDLSMCLNRCGYTSEVAHDALSDAHDVISVIRYKLLGETIHRL